jgi:hypothetical protein
LQNGKAPSAVFLIGGGSQVPKLNEIISQHLKLPKERVVVRGMETVQNLEHDGATLMGPEGITPVGILVKAMKSKERDFAEIKVNGQNVKLFQTKKLKVADALVLAGFNPRDLIPKRGKSMVIFVNEDKKTIYGEYGEPAKILVNNDAGSLDTEIHNGDIITVQPAEPGKDAYGSVKDIIHLQDTIQVNEQKISRYYNVRVNGRNADGGKVLREEDKIAFSQISTVDDLCEYMQLDYNKHDIYCKGEKGNINTLIEGNTPIIIHEKKIAGRDVKSSDVLQEYIEVIYNGTPLKIQKGKTDILFVDIFNYIDVDFRKVQGKLLLKHNGEKANYTSTLKEGDEIWIDWKS